MNDSVCETRVRNISVHEKYFPFITRILRARFAPCDSQIHAVLLLPSKLKPLHAARTATYPKSNDITRKIKRHLSRQTKASLMIIKVD